MKLRLAWLFLACLIGMPALAGEPRPLWKVFPSYPFHNKVNVPLRDSNYLRNLFDLGSTRVHRPYLDNLSLGQLGVPVPFATKIHKTEVVPLSPTGSSFHVSVGGIGLGSSKEEVPGVDARRVVAGVTDEEFARIGLIAENPRDSVGGPVFMGTNRKLPIPLFPVIPCSYPNPTLVFGCLDYLAPKSDDVGVGESWAVGSEIHEIRVPQTEGEERLIASSRSTLIPFFTRLYQTHTSGGGTGGGSGSVTSIATTAPITGGTITTTGTIACATCVKSAAALTSGGVVLGQGLQATAVDANLNWLSPALTIGVATSTTGVLKQTGASSGTVTVTPQAAAGTPTLTYPTASGTFAVTASSPVVLSATTGNLTCPTCVTSAGALTSGGLVLGQGLQATAVDANLNWSSPALTLGVATSTTGQLKLTGATSGTATITPQATSGSPTITLPTTTGTLADSATSPLALSATTGVLTCATCATTTAGGSLTLDQVGSPAAAASFTLTATNKVTFTGTSNTVWPMVTLENTSTGTGAYAEILFKNATNNAYIAWAGHSNSTDSDMLYINSAAKLNIQANTWVLANSAGTTQFGGFDSNGVFGVGTNATIPSDTFHVTAAGAVSAASYAFTKLVVSATAPTVSSGFGTGASITANNGTAAFRVGVGTTSATTGVIGLPTASTGWNCYATDITTNSATVFVTKQTASSTTSATLGNFNTSAAAAAWVDNDVLAVSCFAY